MIFISGQFIIDDFIMFCLEQFVFVFVFICNVGGFVIFDYVFIEMVI